MMVFTENSEVRHPLVTEAFIRKVMSLQPPGSSTNATASAVIGQGLFPGLLPVLTPQVRLVVHVPIVSAVHHAHDPLDAAVLGTPASFLPPDLLDGLFQGDLFQFFSG